MSCLPAGTTAKARRYNKAEDVMNRFFHGRRILVAGLLTLACNAAPAAAETWPSHAITLVVAFGAGSGTDLVARVVGARISEVLHQPVVIENVGGAGGLIGVTKVAKAPPDGYQMVIGAIDTFAQSQSLRKDPPYNAVKDFEPVALAVEQPLVLIVRNNLPVSNLKEFADYTKANHEKMQFGSAGVGAAPHLVCFQLTSSIGVTVTHVPYRGSAPAMQDLIAGNLDFYCSLAAVAKPLITSNSVKALAVLTPERSPLLPNVPTAKEQGFDLTDGFYWMGFFLPKGTPQPIVAKLNAAINTALDTPSVQTRLGDFATTVVAPERRSPAYLEKFLASEIAHWAPIIKASGVTPQ
jgi:tripartite-type tricarboxylate transporter receptor subunit TctC